MTNYLFKITFPKFPKRNSVTFSPFTPLPNQSRSNRFYNSSTPMGMFNKKSPINDFPLQPNYIRLDGVNEENNLALYNFFISYGDIISYNKNSREGYIIIKYKSDGCIRRATNAWSMKSNLFPNVSLRLITEEERNKLTQEKLHLINIIIITLKMNTMLIRNQTG